MSSDTKAPPHTRKQPPSLDETKDVPSASHLLRVLPHEHWQDESTPAFQRVAFALIPPAGCFNPQTHRIVVDDYGGFTFVPR